ncbi:MAG: exodeoxyribonuclease VII small subunit [Candidatus Lernaella stagnicola]|nr:exodeoxyribonuclease VII small subunit [Candidatus Lernaella stagnicola]
MPKKGTKEESTFETQLRRLEDLVGKLESGDLPLEAAVEVFEEGMKLSSSLTKTLDSAEKRVEVLLEKADGTVAVQDLSHEDDDENDEE